MSEQRRQNLEMIRANAAFDVVVVGGGINGIGVYRELALQGLRVLLVERSDFCSGCSAAPSRMIHGGLRYLENGEFGLVRESLRERDALLANAPHFVRPLPTTIPIHSVFSGLLNGAAGFLGLTGAPARRGAVSVKIGLSLYDWVTRKRRRLPPHRFRNADATKREWPELAGGVISSATYYDAWISYPERLGIELLLDTARLAPGSVALNYATLEREGDGFVVEDLIAGARLAVRPRTIVNATGAWVDETRDALSGTPGAGERFVAGTKGSHLILDCTRLYDALNGHMIFFENVDGRVCVVFPYLRKVLAGSTDIRTETVERVRCEPGEVAYILDALRSIFPQVPVGDEHVAFSYSGVRPLPRSDHEFTGRISRDHSVRRIDGQTPQFCMIGGKWTTFRAFAEQATDAVLSELGRARIVDTASLPIGGGKDYPQDAERLASDLSGAYAIDLRRAAHLCDLFGSRAHEVIAFARDRDDDEPLDESVETTAAEIVFLIRNEFVVRLGDLLLRRTPLSITGRVSSTLIERTGAILGRELGWDDDRTRREIETLVSELETYHGVSRSVLERRAANRSMICV